MTSSQEDPGDSDIILVADSDSEDEADLQQTAVGRPGSQLPPFGGSGVGQLASCSAPEQMLDSTPLTADSDSEDEEPSAPQPPPVAPQKVTAAVPMLPPLPRGGSLVEQLGACRERLQVLEKLLSQSQKQNKITDTCNQDLRKQVDQLSLEILKWKTREKMKTVDAEVQTEDYATWSHSDYTSQSHEYYYPSADVPVNTVPANQENKCSVSNATYKFATGTTVQTNTSKVENGQHTDAGLVQNSKEEKGVSLAEMLRVTAEAVVSQTGFTYDEATGLYYDHNTGYYYDSENQLYYDGNTGIYYYCDAETGNYVFHSRVDLPACQMTPEQNREPNRPLKRRMSWDTDSLGNEKNQLTLDQNTGIYYYSHPVTGRMMFHSHVDEHAPTSQEHAPTSQEHAPISQWRTKAKKQRLESTKTPTNEVQEIKAEEETSYHFAAPLVSNISEKKTVEQKKRTKSVLDNAVKQEESPVCENGISDDKTRSTEHFTSVAESGSDAESSEAEEGERATSEVEEECIDDHVSADMEISSDSEETENEESDSGWPPCIRVIVVRSPVLETGTLFVITSVQHATIGSENDMEHAIHIAEPGVSKFHAEVYFDHKLASYVLVDQGSENGTIINGNRIFQPSVKCAPCVVTHGDELKFGETVLSFHMHTGSQTCNGCEPGQIQAFLGLKKKPAISTVKTLTKEEKRRLELKQMRQKYGLRSAPYEECKALNNPNYVDRAGRRRRIVGSEGTFQRDDAPASIYVAMPETNKGHKMLKKMGWKKGEGLGKNKGGIKDPIDMHIRKKKAGLGAAMASSIEDIPTATQNKLNWEKARDRFAKTFGLILP